MTPWAAKRRFIYGGSFVLIIALLTFGIFWKVVYKAPTCTDGVRNGDEKGIDCGGSCKNLCTSDTLTPVVLWSKIFNISGDVYSAVAYIENPNINSRNLSAKYKFSIYDANNVLLTEKEGETSIPKGKKFAVFETGIILKGSKPKSADLTFTSFGPWEKDTAAEPDINLIYGTLSATTTSPRITGTVTNNSLKTIPELELSVFVLDGNENVVAASRSFVDNLVPKDSQDFVFTWPKPFNLGVETCSAPIDVAVTLDKSGSMASEGSVPPEPFSTVLSTAESFVKNLKSGDQAAVVSFGTIGNLESALSLNKQDAINAVRNMSLGSSTEQTNIYDGLEKGRFELSSERGRGDSKKVIVLLTDGVPTEPQDPNVKDNPMIMAQREADQIKSQGIEIYTIGLGKSINADLLKTISTDTDHYFYAPNKETLDSIYSKIGTSICVKKPNVITVIYRTL